MIGSIKHSWPIHVEIIKLLNCSRRMICRPSIMHTHALFWIFSRLRNNFGTVQLHDAATCRLLVCSCVWAKETLYGHLALAAVGSDRCASDFIDACPGYISAFDHKRLIVKGPVFIGCYSPSAFHTISALPPWFDDWAAPDCVHVS